MMVKDVVVRGSHVSVREAVSSLSLLQTLLPISLSTGGQGSKPFLRIVPSSLPALIFIRKTTEM